MADHVGKRAIGYLLVASGSQRKREESLRIQRQAILRYARIHEAEIVAMYFDYDSAGDSGMRSGLLTAMKRLQAGQASLLIVESLHRLGIVDLESLATMMPDSPPAICWGLISVVERLDSRTPDGLRRLKIGSRKRSTEYLSMGERHV
ncbi:MAG TPA: recombinase family protein [Pseudomonadota bacterium]|nr:recombinase family protein [Pseudomonadota bacterium]